MIIIGLFLYYYMCNNNYIDINEVLITKILLYDLFYIILSSILGITA